MSAARPREKLDLLEVVRRAYVLEGSDRDWLRALHEAIHPLLDRGLGTAAYFYRIAPPGRLEISDVDLDGLAPSVLAALGAVAEAARPQHVAGSFAAGSTCATWSEITGLGRALASDASWVRHMHPLGIHDYLAMNAPATPHEGCNIGAAVPLPARTPHGTRLAWSRVAAHIAAGLRLRRALRASATVGAREALRDRASHVARAQPRHSGADTDEARTFWKELVSGRWSLLDHFDRDGRRFFVALKNAPGVPADPVRALTERERQVAWHVGLGHSNKHVAYTLGISDRTVVTHLRTALRKLGVSESSQLIALVLGLLGGDPPKA